jgi:anti-sigma B factor antagonist
MALQLVSRLVGDVLILDVSGSITQGQGCFALRDSVKSALGEGQKKILLNIAAADYIDSTGVGELTYAFTRTRMQGGDLKLFGLTKKVHDLLQITRLYTVFDVYDDESKALEAFHVAPFHCCCPLCGEASGPPVVAARWIMWPPQACRNTRCEATFAVVSSRTGGQAIVRTVRIQTYKDEYFELLPGPPFTVKIVGRLDLFSSSALKKSWQAIPVPRRVIFDLCGTTEIDKAGREALADVLAKQEKDARAVVSLEGLGSEQASMFPSGPPFYQSKATALAALGDVSDAPPLQVRVLNE